MSDQPPTPTPSPRRLPHVYGNARADTAPYFIPLSTHTKENMNPLPPSCMDRRPASSTWLNSAMPGWVDGAANPPQFYHTVEEMEQTRREHGIFARLDRAALLDPSTETSPSHQPSPPAAASRAHSPQPGIVMPPRLQRSLPPLSLVAPPCPPVTPVSVAPSPANEGLNSANGIDENIQSFLVTVGINYLKPTDKQGRSKQVVAKMTEVNKRERMQLSASTTRVDFITWCLKVHHLHGKYRPGTTSGPRFKIWWNRALGGRTKAPQVDTDHDWSVALTSLLLRKTDTEILAEFDLSNMSGFLHNQPLDPTLDNDVELLHGTQVPQLSMFSTEEQLHGKIIVGLKKKWLCHTHVGEHGDPGYCYVLPVTAEHIGLNNRKLKAWAAAIAGHEYSINDPPPQVIDGGSREVPLVKARGRTGPHATASTSSSSSELISLMTLAMMQQMSSLQGTTIQPVQASVSHPPFANISSGEELRACLMDFRNLKDIDFLPYHDSLLALDFTPDIICDVPASRLSELLGGAVEGKVRKLQAFSKSWDLQLNKIRSSN
ncbi:hypothetical protein BDW22DRAFT_1432176 [Trametopsis cervina]|nr:hypothetical protein BDW22DRAFT_1432176 [Trametopsis cervina]